MITEIENNGKLSPVMEMFNLFHRNKRVDGRYKLAAMYNELLDICVQSHMKFGIDDMSHLAKWCSVHSEHFYTRVIREGNKSALKSLHQAMRRPPFVLRTWKYENGQYTAEESLLHEDKVFRWQGDEVRVTSFKEKENGQWSVIACKQIHIPLEHGVNETKTVKMYRLTQAEMDERFDLDCQYVTLIRKVEAHAGENHLRWAYRLMSNASIWCENCCKEEGIYFYDRVWLYGDAKDSGHGIDAIEAHCERCESAVVTFPREATIRAYMVKLEEDVQMTDQQIARGLLVIKNGNLFPDLIKRWLVLARKLPELDPMCRCGHLASVHGEKNGESHPGETKTGACPCVLSRAQAASHEAYHFYRREAK